MSPQEISAMLRRHRIAIAITVLAACMLGFHLVRGNPGYIDSGGVAFTAPRNPVSMFQNMRSLRVVEEVSTSFMMGSQGESEVRAAGGTAHYNVAMLNLYNEEYPNYSQPYVTITVMSDSPKEAQQTFGSVLGVLREATEILQKRVGANIKNEVTATLVSEPTGPIAQRGSYKRSYTALTVLGIIAIYVIGRALDRCAPRRQPRHRARSRGHHTVALRSGLVAGG